MDLLRKIGEPLEVEVGVEFEPIPSPVVRLYAKIRKLRLLMEENEDDNRREDNKRSDKHDESACQRDEVKHAV